MKPSPGNSFFKFVLGFLIFIGLSFGITVAVAKYTAQQQSQQEAAAATAQLLK